MRSPAGKSCHVVLAFFVLMSVLLWSRVPAFAQGPSLDSVCRDLTAFDVTTGCSSSDGLPPA